MFPTHKPSTQGSPRYRLTTLGYQKYNTYSVEKCGLISYLWHDLFRYQRKRITIESLIQSNKLFVNHRRRKCCANMLMNISAIVNVVTMQHRMCYVGIPMNVSSIINSLMVQLGTSCSFDSPGLARNEPTPGQRSQGDSTP